MKKLDFRTGDGVFTWVPSATTRKTVNKSGCEKSGVEVGLQDLFYSVFRSLDKMMATVATSDLSNPDELRASLRAHAWSMEETVNLHSNKPSR